MYNDATDLVDINKDVAIISIPSDLGWNIEYWSFSIQIFFPVWYIFRYMQIKENVTQDIRKLLVLYWNTYKYNLQIKFIWIIIESECSRLAYRKNRTLLKI